MTSPALQQVQVAKQTVWGTAVTPTAKLMGVEDCSIEPIVATTLQGERRGSLAPGFNTNLSQIGGSGQLDVLASYQDIAYLLDGLFSEATPAAAPGYARTYAAPLTAIPTPRMTTLVHGQTGGVYQLDGALGTQLTITGEHSAAAKASMRYEGLRVVGGTLSALSDRSVDFMMGNQAKLYIDTWAGTAGTTEITATSWAFQLTVNPNRKLNRSLGSLIPVSWQDGDAENRWGGELKLSLEVNATTAAYLNVMLQATPAVFERQVRITYTGPNANQSFQITFAGAALTAPSLFSDMDGLVSFDVTLTGKYNPTLANWLSIVATSATQTLA